MFAPSKVNRVTRICYNATTGMEYDSSSSVQLLGGIRDAILQPIDVLSNRICDYQRRRPIFARVLAAGI